jgi:uncharacterized protein YodC (DUF2158 family)
MTNQTTFDIGDIVQLKSGGPEMTVQSVPTSTGTLHKCQWFAGKKLEVGLFPYASLNTIKPDGK